MRKLFVLCLTLYLLFLATTAVAQEIAVTAASAFEQGDYAGAVTLYENLLERYGDQGSVYYNLAVSYAHAGETGRAVLNLRRAQAFFPRDTDLAMNLQILRAQRLTIEGDEVFILDGIAATVSTLLTLSELVSITYAAWVIWFLIAAGALLWHGRRSVLGRMLAGFTIPMMLLVIVLLVRVYVGQARPSAVIVADVTSVMSGAGDQYLQQYVLYEGTELRIVEHTEDRQWLRFIMPDMRQGWISAADVEFVGFS